MAEESLKGKTIKASIWSSIDNISNIGVTFIVGVVLARLLSPTEYGLIGIILIFVNIFNSIVNSGLSSALIRKNNATEEDYSTMFITNMVISVILAAILFFSSPYIAIFFNQPQLDALTKVMSFIIVINALGIVQHTIITKKIDFKTQTKVSLIASICSGGIGIIMAFMEYGVWSLVGQQISRQLLNTLLLWIYNKWIPKLCFSLHSFKELFGFGWKILVSSLIDVLWMDIYKIVIGKFYDTATLGQYTQASHYSSIFSTNLTNVVQRVSYPVLSSIQDDVKRMRSGYSKIIKVTMLITFVLMLGLAAVAEPIILVLIGDKWMIAAKFLPIICLQMMLYPLHAINLNMLKVLGRSDLFLKLEILKKIISVIPLLLGIFINIYWMLWASVVNGIIAYFINSYYSGKFIDYSTIDQIKDILPSFGIAAIMSIVVYLVSFIPLSLYILLPAQIIIGAILVIALCEIFKLEEYREVKNIILMSISKLKNNIC